MEIKKENLVAAYNTADDSGKKMLQALFPEAQFETPQTADNRPVTERIKTFADAAKAVGINDPEGWEDGYSDVEPDIFAYFKLRIIVQALNEGWKPQFTTEEWRYYPWFWLYTEQEIEDMDEDEKNDRRMMNTGDYVTDYAGFAFALSDNVPSYTTATFGSRLCLKTPELATYCGKQFIGIWADYLLTRKEA